MLGVTVSKAIQIRDVPDDVHAVLRARAAATGMSMSEYLRSELITMAARPTLDEVIARAQSRHGGASHGAIVRVIREARDDPGRP
jgi:plasmid stability protein